MSNLLLGANCIQCGGCLGLGYEFLSDDGSGKIIVRDGTYLNADDPEYTSLLEVCPVGAFSLDSSQKKKNESEQLEEIIESLRNWNGIPEAQGHKDMPFNVKEYHIATTADSPGAHSYKYSSSSQAERAAADEFDRIMYSKIDTFILQILSEYRVKQLKPWFSMEEEDKSVYAAANRQISEILGRAVQILGDRIPSDFAEFDAWVGNDVTYKMLERGEVMGNNYVSNIRSKFDSYDWTDRSHYLIEIDTMERDEMVEKKGLFGSSSYVTKTKYCYHGVENACRELAGDIKYACDDLRDEIEQDAAGYVNSVIYTYNKAAKEELKKKIKQLEECLKNGVENYMQKKEKSFSTHDTLPGFVRLLG